MVRALALALSLCTASPALAQFDITTKTGSWAGAGQVLRGGEIDEVTCRVTIGPSGAATQVEGRCAVPEGAVPFDVLMTPQGDGSYLATGRTLERPGETAITELRGTPDANALTLRGTAPGETLTVQFVPRPSGGLRIATQRLTPSGDENTSVVELTPR